MTEFLQVVTEREYTERSIPIGQPTTLAESVVRAVRGYMNTMDDQDVRDLYQLVLSEVEAPLLDCVLKRTNNNQSQTALILGLNRGTLRKKLKKYGML